VSGRPIVVVPCYNEERRLEVDRFLAFARDADLELLFVDDGSKDGTLRVLQDARARAPDRVHVLPLAQNGGKAEAVRQGLLDAMDRGAPIAGYLDADLATPPEEMARVLRALDDPALSVVMGARVSLLGRDVQRTPARHYLGRVFATAASLILNMRVYDTQCGAKALRTSPALRAALDERFLSRWAFDVELIGRLLAEGVPVSAFFEVPLLVWRDVKGSKLGAGAMANVLADLARIRADLARRRSRPR
jgi:dolichyl-phosphate beta-glucosyltransferase